MAYKNTIATLHPTDNSGRISRRVLASKGSADRVGVGQDAVKLSFMILAAALSLGVSRASSHRSKTDNRPGYSGEALFSITTPSVAVGLKESSVSSYPLPRSNSFRQLTHLFARFCATANVCDVAARRHQCASSVSIL